jgi:hypothetical protein
MPIANCDAVKPQTKVLQCLPKSSLGCTLTIRKTDPKFCECSSDAVRCSIDVGCVYNRTNAAYVAQCENDCPAFKDHCDPFAWAEKMPATTVAPATNASSSPYGDCQAEVVTPCLGAAFECALGRGDGDCKCREQFHTCLRGKCNPFAGNAQASRDCLAACPNARFCSSATTTAVGLAVVLVVLLNAFSL